MGMEINAWIAAGMMFGAVMMIWNVILTVRTVRLRKMLKRWVGEGDLASADAVLSGIQTEQRELREQQKEIQAAVAHIRERLRRMKGHAGVVRYNAFAERGSAMSFSVALVDDDCNGLVLSGIRDREATLMYAKPVAEGTSPYPLTPEETEAIRSALRQDSPQRTV